VHKGAPAGDAEPVGLADLAMQALGEVSRSIRKLMVLKYSENNLPLSLL